MPEVAGVTQAYWLTILNDVGNNQDFRVLRQLEWMQHMDLQSAEAAAEINLLLWRNVLITEHQHMMVEVGMVHALEIAERQGLRQIQPQHLRTERRIEGFDT